MLIYFPMLDVWSQEAVALVKTLPSVANERKTLPRRPIHLLSVAVDASGNAELKQVCGRWRLFWSCACARQSVFAKYLMGDACCRECRLLEESGQDPNARCRSCCECALLERARASCHSPLRTRHPLCPYAALQTLDSVLSDFKGRGFDFEYKEKADAGAEEPKPDNQA